MIKCPYGLKYWKMFFLCNAKVQQFSAEVYPFATDPYPDVSCTSEALGF